MIEILRSAEHLAPMSLAELNAHAALHTRIDRKYIVDEAIVAEMISVHRADLAILEIDARRDFAYRSVYFDTPDMDLYTQAALNRRHRFKVRTRVYEDTELAVLEVKTKDGRGRTAKRQLAYHLDNRTKLTADGERFVNAIVNRPELVGLLEPVVTTSYRRSTLVAAHAEARITVDSGLLCRSTSGAEVTLDKLIVETKSERRVSSFDRWLWRRGIRPIRMSKCCTALAVMRPDLPSNKWNRTLDRHFR